VIVYRVAQPLPSGQFKLSDRCHQEWEETDPGMWGGLCPQSLPGGTRAISLSLSLPLAGTGVSQGQSRTSFWITKTELPCARVRVVLQRDDQPCCPWLTYVMA
jgi:hypothetical protein